jgi:hypothetical protein
MQVSSYTNQYQMLQTKQNPVTIPVEPKDPQYSKEDIYKASKGNLTIGDEGSLELTPQCEINVENAKNAKADEISAKAQEEKDATRTTFTNLLETSSKKSQVEIYLAVATDGKIDDDNQMVNILSSLRDVQKQNNIVQAYATYQELQDKTPRIIQ